jgi:hypothetical protein
VTEPTNQSRLPARIRNMGRREKTLAGVLGGMAIIAVIFVLMSGGGGTIEGVSSNPLVRATPTPTVTSTAPPETGQAFEGKDPFQPLVVAVPPAPSGSPTPTPTGSVTGVNGGNNNSSAVTVTLLDVRKQGGKLVATVDVNSKDYNVSQGQTFANDFRVLSLSSSCGTFVFGDERFSLCIGQQVNK